MAIPVTTPHPPVQNETVDVVNRLRQVLMHVDLECECQESLASALERFTALEKRRVSRRQLVEARDHKDRIAATLMLLSELDELTEGEPDRSVFKEMALLFSDIAESAAAGAAALNRITDR